MNQDSMEPPGRLSIPPRQNPLATAHQKAVAALADQAEAQLRWLGADPAGSQWRLPVLAGVFLVETSTGSVCSEDGKKVQPTWQILALHYLAIRARPPDYPPEVTFASLPGGKVYAGVYEQRVNRRLCAGVGKDLHRLQGAAAVLGAHPVEGGDGAFEVMAFPRIPIRLIWYAGDAELAPSCTLLLPRNIDSFLCTEDIVVLSESFVSRLSGKPF
jgi:hypothetical protein